MCLNHVVELVVSSPGQCALRNFSLHQPSSFREISPTVGVRVKVRVLTFEGPRDELEYSIATKTVITFGAINRLRAMRSPSSTGKIMWHPCRTPPCIVTPTPTIVQYHPPTMVAVTVAVCNCHFLSSIYLYYEYKQESILPYIIIKLIMSQEG